MTPSESQTDLTECIEDLELAKVSRCLNRWRAAIAMQERLSELAARTHKRSLQGDAFRRWATRTKRRRDEKNCETLMERKEFRLLGEAWLEWKHRVAARARTRWEEDMNNKEMALKERDDQLVLHSALKVGWQAGVVHGHMLTS
jgi:hypothetical protein